jgi:hypothetical protein
LNGNSSQVLTGDGTWVAQLGNGTVANANYADFAGTADVANAVTLANVSGAGNIASINLDGNASNVLAGDGTFVTKNSVAGNSGEIQFNSNGVFGGSSNLVFDDANSTFTAWADKIQMGLNTVANVSGGVAIGSYSASTAEGGIAVGYGSTVGANADYAVAIGIATVFANAMDAIAIGRAGITSANSIAIGSGATAGEYNNPSSSSAIAIGTGAYSESANSIAFGAGSYISVGAPDSIAMGTSAHALASSGIAIGNNANVLSLNGVAIGANAFCDVENTIVLGSDIVSNTKVQGSLTVTDITTLGDVANVKITGGQYGQFLKTDGEGNLIFDDATANLGNIATINLSGNSLQYLAGNGAWAGFNVGNIITTNYNGNALQVLNGVGSFITPPASGANGQIQVNSNGALAGYANLTWNDGLGQVTARRFAATAEMSSPILSSPVINGGGRTIQVSAGGSGIGSGNINIISSGNDATDGGNINIRSGIATKTSNIYIGEPTQSSNNRSRTTITGDVVLKTPVPASASANGIAGQTAVDSGFIYVCVATNTWQRAALSTW